MGLAVGGLLLWLIAVGVGIWVYWVGGNVAWYSLRYMVSTDKVRVDAKPRDCNFMSAPIGDKGCHYTPSVTAINAAGVTVGGDRTPTFSRDTKTSKPIVSYDNGKNWEWWPFDIPDPKIEKVIVMWRKVTEE